MKKNDNSKRVVVIAARRSAVSTIPGELNQMSDVELLADVFREVSNGLHKWINSAIAGSAFPVERDNLCRKSVLAAGLSPKINSGTISKTCSSSDEALSIAYQRILSSKSRAVLVGGCEKVSNSSYMLSFKKNRVKDSIKNQLPLLSDIEKRINEDEMHYISEMLAYRYNVTRDMQDSFAIKSREKAREAFNEHKFGDEIVPIKYSKERTERLFIDELLQQCFDEKEIRNGVPMFVQNGTLTKYNTAPMCDCAVAMVIMDYALSKSLGLNHLVEIKDVSSSGVGKDEIGFAMVKCVEKILSDNNLKKDEIDLYEINEAFAAQAINTVKTLGINIDNVNVNGGNLALGYPVGASGMRMSVTLIHEMIRSKSKYGISVMCGGGSMANATLFQNTLSL